jgi:hypothetical protein
MTNDDGRKPEGAPERSPTAGAGAPSGVDGNGQCCSCPNDLVVKWPA